LFESVIATTDLTQMGVVATCFSADGAREHWNPEGAVM